MVIDSLKKFKSIIETDLSKKSERHIRFINVERMDYWIKVKDILNSYCENHLILSDYCGDKDLTPKTLRLIADLKKVKVNTVVIPLSEYFRINNNRADQVLTNIVSLEHEFDSKEDNFRIYFPMYKMKSRLERMSRADSRLMNYIWFLHLGESDDDYSLTILPRTYKTKIKGNNRNGYREYLTYWEDNPSKPIILHTDNAVYYKDNIYNDNVIILINAFDILKYHKFFDLNVFEEYGDEKEWDNLLRKAGCENTLSSFLKRYFAMSAFNANELIMRWNKQKDDFGKWLAWLWLKTEDCPSYLEHCVSKCNKWTELIQSSINSIFDYETSSSNYWQIYRERKDLLSKLDLNLFPNTFWNIWDNLPTDKRVCYLTDVTQAEKEEIIRNIGWIHAQKNSDVILENIYPDVSAYISSYSSKYTEIDEYFNIYRKQKLVNSFSDSFVKKVNEIGETKGLWWQIGMKSRNKLVDETYDENSYIFFVDALGAEFYCFILYLLNKEYNSVYFDAQIAFAELPTVTEKNKGFIVNRNAEDRIPDLDDIKHNGDYPNYICAELEIVREVINKAISKLEMYRKIIITADHGSSRGVVLAKGKTIKAENNVKGERDGRYCVDGDNTYESKLPCCIDIENYHVLANYDRFSVSGAAKNENHGGASLEEVLVPVIVLSREPIFEKISIVDYDRNVKPINGKAHVSFKLDKEIDDVIAVVLGQRYICFKKDERWSFEADVGTRSEYSVQLISNSVIGEFKYTVHKGIKKKQDIY